VKPKWLASGVTVAVLATVTGSLLLGAASVQTGRASSSGSQRPATAIEIAAATPTASATCPTGRFCISGSVTGVSPATGQTETLTLTNPNAFPIFVTSLGLAASDVGSCPGSITIGSPGFVASDTSPIPTDAIPVASATSSGPGTATKTITVRWADSKTINQTPCLHTPIPLTYSGHALWYGNCITGAQNGGLTVAAPTVACVASTGRVTGGITVASGAGLVLDPGATVTGGVNAANKATEIMLCGASISGGVTVTKATGQVVIGNGSYCPGNTISGGLTVTNNTGGVKVVGNSVNGQTNVSNNSGPTPSP
jgi:hypothetical protein